ncbi:hypothetical protein THAOC_27215, partial [Thalassiosira oceanica]
SKRPKKIISRRDKASSPLSDPSTRRSTITTSWRLSQEVSRPTLTITCSMPCRPKSYITTNSEDAHGPYLLNRDYFGQKEPDCRFERQTLSLLMTCSNQLS